MEVKQGEEGFKKGKWMQSSERAKQSLALNKTVTYRQH